MSLRRALMFTTLVAFVVPPLTAQDRDTKVRDDRAAFADDESWVYNDLSVGLAQAKKEKKPLLVVFRCIP